MSGTTSGRPAPEPLFQWAKLSAKPRLHLRVTEADPSALLEPRRISSRLLDILDPQFVDSHFDEQELIGELELVVLEGCVPLLLEGNLLPELGGAAFEDTHIVRMQLRGRR